MSTLSPSFIDLLDHVEALAAASDVSVMIDAEHPGTIEVEILDQDSQGFTLCLAADGTYTLYATGG